MRSARWFCGWFLLIAGSFRSEWGWGGPLTGRPKLFSSLLASPVLPESAQGVTACYT